MGPKPPSFHGVWGIAPRTKRGVGCNPASPEAESLSKPGKDGAGFYIGFENQCSPASPYLASESL